MYIRFSLQPDDCTQFQEALTRLPPSDGRATNNEKIEQFFIGFPAWITTMKELYKWPSKSVHSVFGGGGIEFEADLKHAIYFQRRKKC